MMMTISLVLLALLLPPVVYDLVRRPTIRRLGLRNVTRRKGEAALVVGGSMLATALIAASFVVGTSFDESIRTVAANRWGPIDELVIVDDPAEAGEVAAVLTELPTESVDGILPATTANVAVASIGGDRRVEPSAQLLEADTASAQAFGGDPLATGLAQVTPFDDDVVVINDRLADEIDVMVGDAIELYIGTDAHEVTVGHVVPATGLAGYADVLVNPGVFSGAVAASGTDVSGVATSAVLISNVGGVFDGADLTATVEEQIAALTGESGHGIEVVDVKRQILDDAEAEGAEMTELFGTIGGFSVVAGILLVINLFVMLAGERNVELGTMRAVGLRRGSILRAFALEGAIYGVLAAIVGALLGIGVAAAVMAFAATFLAGHEGLEISLAVQGRDLLGGALIGLAISQLTVVLTSFRMTRINIVRALRDLPAQAKARSRLRRVLVGALGVSAGAGLYFVAGANAHAAMIGPVLVAVASIPFLGFVMPRRVATVIGCGAALVWPAAVFGLLPEVMDDPDISVFLLQGILLVGLATAVFAALDSVWLRLAGRLSGGGIASRLGLAHPLARPVRSALLVAMYALVLFTVTFMAVLNTVFQASAPELASHAGGQYALVVDSNRTAPIDAGELAARDGIVGVAEIRRGILEVRSESNLDTSEDWFGSAISPDWDVAAAPLAPTFAGEFATQEDVWAAVSAGDTEDGAYWVVVPDYTEYEAGQWLDLVAADGSTVAAKVGGLSRNNWLVDAGIYVSDELSTTLFGDERPVSRQYVAVAEGVDIEQLADEITASAPEQGVDARSFISVARIELDEQEGFLTMLQGYLGLGLLIGIAGLSVVLIRSVRERRRELGMLKAVGVPTGQTQRAFLFEAAFIGVQGVVLGIGLGVLSAWQVLTQSTAFEEDLRFALPGTWLIGLAVLALAASLAAAIGPARRAGRTPPAVALRVTG